MIGADEMQGVAKILHLGNVRISLVLAGHPKRGGDVKRGTPEKEGLPANSGGDVKKSLTEYKQKSEKLSFLAFRTPQGV